MTSRGVESSGAAADLPYMETHMIDFSLLTSSSPTLASMELQKLHAALTSWGCFQLVNHGMSIEYLDEVRNVGKQFFSLPEEEKEKYSRTATDPEGYGTDSISSDNVPLKWQFRLFLAVYPLEARKVHRWPQSPQSFREILQDYSSKVKSLHEVVVQAMARCLKLNDNAFLDEYGGVAEIVSRYQLYVPCSLTDLIRASSRHADSSALTFLLQDKEVEALEVEKDGQWFKAPVFPDAIFVNAGDVMEIMSNGIFKSAIHRVVPNPRRERISVPLFCAPPQSKEIGPLKELVTNDQPAMYKRVKHYREIFFRYHPTGTRPITTVKI